MSPSTTMSDRCSRARRRACRASPTSVDCAPGVDSGGRPGTTSSARSIPPLGAGAVRDRRPTKSSSARLAAHVRRRSDEIEARLRQGPERRAALRRAARTIVTPVREVRRQVDVEGLRRVASGPRDRRDRCDRCEASPSRREAIVRAAFSRARARENAAPPIRVARAPGLAPCGLGARRRGGRRAPSVASHVARSSGSATAAQRRASREATARHRGVASAGGPARRTPTGRRPACRRPRRRWPCIAPRARRRRSPRSGSRRSPSRRRSRGMRRARTCRSRWPRGRPRGAGRAARARERTRRRS